MHPIHPNDPNDPNHPIHRIILVYYLSTDLCPPCPVKFVYDSGAHFTGVTSDLCPPTSDLCPYKTSANCDFNFLNINAPQTNIVSATAQKYMV